MKLFEFFTIHWYVDSTDSGGSGVFILIVNRVVILLPPTLSCWCGWTVGRMGSLVFLLCPVLLPARRSQEEVKLSKGNWNKKTGWENVTAQHLRELAHHVRAHPPVLQCLVKLVLEMEKAPLRIVELLQSFGFRRWSTPRWTVKAAMIVWCLVTGSPTSWPLTFLASHPTNLKCSRLNF